MNTIRTLSIAAATVAFAASSAFAAQPAAGEGPFFAVQAGTPTVARQAVTQAPVAGEFSWVAAPQTSTVTRAEVRAALQMAIHNGNLPKSGEAL